MWQAIGEQLGDWLGRPYPISEHQGLGGGDSHRCFRVSDGHHPLFLKINAASCHECLAAEVDGLDHLARIAAIATPTVIGEGQVDGHALLALDWLELRRNVSDLSWEQFGRQLAEQHLATDQAMYGFDDDNYLGLSVQPNRWQRHWHTFFAEQRLGWQLELAAEHGHDFGDIDVLVECASNLLKHHQPKPAMLHGDLWSGNLGFVGDKAVCFDPAVYYGDRECDLAMTELFGPLPAPFYRGYEAVAPLPADAGERKALYQLYYQLYHACHFGSHYVADCRQATRRLLAA